MEQKDIELLQSLLPSNEELASLWHEHMELEKKLDDMSTRVYLTAEEQVEFQRLKKVKLAGRDRIESILAEHRA
jgi:uncharacterized protein YdcH (DUF465 family)